MGIRASAHQVQEVVESVGPGTALEEQVRVTFRESSGADADPTVRHGRVTDIAEVPVGRLATVRRPASYNGMRHYISRMVVANEGVNTAVWAESRNELTHFRDVVISQPVRSAMSQPARLEFAFAHGVGSHIPDLLIETDDGHRLLYDITKDDPRDDPVRSAVFRLTAEVARSLGWRYAVRFPCTQQRSRNVDLVWAHRGSTREIAPATPELVELLGQLPLPLHVVVHRWSSKAGALAKVWSALAHRHFYADLDRPLSPEALILPRPVARAHQWEWLP